MNTGDESVLVEGYWQNGRLCGAGREITNNGSHYIGFFKDNVKCGSGVLKQVDGFKYKGNFTNDLPNGQGEARYPEGRKSFSLKIYYRCV